MLIDMFVAVVRPLELAGRGVTHVVRLTSNTHSLVGCAPDEVLAEPFGNVQKRVCPARESRRQESMVKWLCKMPKERPLASSFATVNFQLRPGRKGTKGSADQAQGRRSQYEGRSRRDGSNCAYACVGSDVSSCALAP
jgi:hypothetical protein